MLEILKKINHHKETSAVFKKSLGHVTTVIQNLLGGRVI